MGDSGLYNRHGRGYPDVAAVADNIALWYEGSFGHTGGTSASEKAQSKDFKNSLGIANMGCRYPDICGYNQSHY